jgi:hypothetical protein
METDCIIPTTQNNANRDLDVKTIPGWALREGKNDRETRKAV